MTNRTENRLLKNIKKHLFQFIQYIIGFSYYSRSSKAFDRFKIDKTRYVKKNVPKNSMLKYFENNTRGPGIWKWKHYFDIYESHLGHFRDNNVTILEIGIFSGGSLAMWKEVFGENSRVIGIDIEPDCKIYEEADKDIWVYIGDQAKKSFWSELLPIIGNVDIVIDDGGHELYQQIATFESLFPAINPGGVYICEDIHGKNNQLMNYFLGISSSLNEYRGASRLDGTVVNCSTIQSVINSIHNYPFCTVVEKNKSTIEQLTAPKMGTQWQPFL